MTEAAAAREQILNWLADSKGDMLALLETLVNMDSGSYDKAGVDAVGDVIEQFLQGTASRRRAYRLQTRVTPSERRCRHKPATVR